jgi:hypothetical protein
MQRNYFWFVPTLGDSRYPLLEELYRAAELLFPPLPGSGQKHLTGHVLRWPFDSAVTKKPALLVSQNPA